MSFIARINQRLSVSICGPCPLFNVCLSSLYLLHFLLLYHDSPEVTEIGVRDMPQEHSMILPKKSCP